MNVERFFTQGRPSQEAREPTVVVRRVAAVVSVLGFPLAQWLIDGADLRPWVLTPSGGAVYGVTVVALIAVWIASYVVVMRFRRRLAQAPDHHLDERELQVRDESHLVAYRIMLAVVAVATGIALVLGMATDVEVISRDVFVSTGVSLLMVFLVMPSAVVAWRERDPDDGLDDQPGIVGG